MAIHQKVHPIMSAESPNFIYKTACKLDWHLSRRSYCLYKPGETLFEANKLQKFPETCFLLISCVSGMSLKNGLSQLRGISCTMHYSVILILHINNTSVQLRFILYFIVFFWNFPYLFLTWIKNNKKNQTFLILIVFWLKISS